MLKPISKNINRVNSDLQLSAPGKMTTTQSVKQKIEQLEQAQLHLESAIENLESLEGQTKNQDINNQIDALQREAMEYHEQIEQQLTELKANQKKQPGL